MMFAAALMSAAAITAALAPSPSDLCDAIARDAGSRGYLLKGPSGQPWDGTCLIEDWTDNGFDWDVYEIQDLELEDYIEDTTETEVVITLPTVIIYGSVRL